jgi:YVTN family beta-propeller protein
MSRPLNYRLIVIAVLILSLAAIEISLEYRPSFLRPGLRLYAYVGNADDGTVSVIDLIRVGNIATIPVGPTPSGLRANPKLDQVWGVSTQGGYAFVIDTRTGKVAARIPVGLSPFAVDFSPDGSHAYIAASGSSTLVVIDCRTGQVVGHARTGRHPWLARVTPDGKLVLVPNRDDRRRFAPRAGCDSPGQFGCVRFRHWHERSLSGGPAAARSGHQFEDERHTGRAADEAGRWRTLREHPQLAWP